MYVIYLFMHFNRSLLFPPPLLSLIHLELKRFFFPLTLLKAVALGEVAPPPFLLILTYLFNPSGAEAVQGPRAPTLCLAETTVSRSPPSAARPGCSGVSRP